MWLLISLQTLCASQELNLDLGFRLGLALPHSHPQTQLKSTVIWLREILREMGLHDMVAKPTVVECDSKGAIDWAAFGKITPGNRSLKVAIHQALQERQNTENELYYLLVPGTFNRSDRRRARRTMLSS